MFDKLNVEVETPVESVTNDEDKLEVVFDKFDETSLIMFDKLPIEVETPDESVTKDEDKLTFVFDKFNETS
jgi:hypothetical protein